MDYPINLRRAYKWGLRTALVSGPASFLILVAWGLRLDKHVSARPHLVTMTFMLLLLVAVGAGLVAVIAATQLATHKAFVAGYSTGATDTAVKIGRQSQEGRPDLRVVDSDTT